MSVQSIYRVFSPGDTVRLGGGYEVHEVKGVLVTRSGFRYDLHSTTRKRWMKSVPHERLNLVERKSVEVPVCGQPTQSGQCTEPLDEDGRCDSEYEHVDADGLRPGECRDCHKGQHGMVKDGRCVCCGRKA